MPIKICSGKRGRCGNQATYRGRCAECNAANQRTIKRAAPSVYRSKRWRTLRKYLLSRNPLCACGCGQLATDVDHIKAIEDGGAVWDNANLQCLAHSCHARKTRREMQARTHKTAA